jgi:beta-glucosidase
MLNSTNYQLMCEIADENSVFPSGMNSAATWSTSLMNARGNAMGMEHRGKGVDVQLGPVAGPIGRSPEGGRNWEGTHSYRSA